LGGRFVEVHALLHLSAGDVIVALGLIAMASATV